MVLTTGSATAQDWPQFRGPNGNGESDSEAPTKWDEKTNLIWKKQIPGHGSSSPIVVGDKIILTAFSGYGIDPDDTGQLENLKLHTICFDRATGELIWDKSISSSSNEQKFSRRVADHGYTSGTPASDGKSVYAFFGVSGCVAYDLDGNQLWHNKELGTNTAGFGSASSPVVDDRHVYLNASIESGTLFALDKKNGSVVWSRQNVVKSWSTPCLAKNERGEMELVINQKFTLFGLDPADGKELWSCKGIEDYVVPVPISENGVVYCLGGRSNRAMAVKLGGKGDVTDSHRLWMVNIGANVTSPILHEGHLYWASDKGIANCLKASDGKAVFRERMPTQARVYASIVRSGNRLYLTTRDSGVWVLEANPTFNALALNVFDADEEMFNASPAIDGGRILLRNNKFLYCIGTTADSDQ
ncbi:MAG: PQQ-binding-like beta-propeller repeat protein [Planctomycetota bacterium]